MQAVLSVSHPPPSLRDNKQPPVANPNPERREWREEQDLEAQRQMAAWALGMLITAVFSVESAAGVVYVKRTLELNRKLLVEARNTTRAAEQAILVQMRIEQPLLRAEEALEYQLMRRTIG